MSVVLDGFSYNILLQGYHHDQRKFTGEARGNTGAFIHVDTGVFDNRYALTLICTVNDIQNLRTSFAKASYTNSALAFIDEEGVAWLPTTGTDDSTHIYDSGVYFDGDLLPDPMTPRGWSNGNRFQVPIALIANAAGLASAGSGIGDIGGDLIYEIPGGIINGTNPTFTLAHSAKIITFQTGFIPQTGDVLFCWYNDSIIILVRNIGTQELEVQFTWD